MESLSFSILNGDKFNYLGNIPQDFQKLKKLLDINLLLINTKKKIDFLIGFFGNFSISIDYNKSIIFTTHEKIITEETSAKMIKKL